MLRSEYSLLEFSGFVVYCLIIKVPVVALNFFVPSNFYRISHLLFFVKNFFIFFSFFLAVYLL